MCLRIQPDPVPVRIPENFLSELFTERRRNGVAEWGRWDVNPEGLMGARA